VFAKNSNGSQYHIPTATNR
jgi:hypothetical protein